MAKIEPGQQSKKKRRAKQKADAIQKAWGAVVQRYRKRAGKVSQHLLSKRAGLSENAVGDLERGTRRIDRREVLQILGALQVSPEEFLKELTPLLEKVLHRSDEQEGEGGPEAADMGAATSNGEPERRESSNVFFLSVGVARQGGDADSLVLLMKELLSQHVAKESGLKEGKSG